MVGSSLTKVGKVSSGNITIGGLITTIALHDKPIFGTSHIDLDMLVNNDID